MSTHWQPKEEITRLEDATTPIQLQVGRTAKKPLATFTEDAPDMITRANDYIGQPKTVSVNSSADAVSPLSPNVPLRTPSSPTPPQVVVVPPVLAVVAPQQNHPQPTGRPMSNEQQPVVNNYYGSEQQHNYPHGHYPVQHPNHAYYGAQPQQYGSVPLVVQQAPAPGYAVETAKVSGTDLTKGVLRIGADTYDLTGAVLGSLEFKALFIQALTDILARDLNVQAALFTPKEREQDDRISGLSAAVATSDAALAAATTKLKHALQCVFYKDGAIVFPGLQNDCGIDAKVVIPPVTSASYDLKSNTLTVGEASVVIPVSDIAKAATQTVLDNAFKGALPDVVKADRITDVMVGVEGDCHPAQIASMELFSQAILSDGIPTLCEKNLIKEVEVPTKLLGFGAKCREFGYVSLEKMMLAMSKFLVKAPKGSFPVELRGYGATDGILEQRYPVVVKPYTILANNGAIVASGDTSLGVVKTNTIDVIITEPGMYVVDARWAGLIKTNIGGTVPSGHADRRIELLVNGATVISNADVTFYDAPDLQLNYAGSLMLLVNCAVGTRLSVQGVFLGGGELSVTTGVGAITAIKLGTAEISINP